ncbi:hypothetical protein [Actinoplanes sp. NPDC051851]|uniref:hypothetical protein n=1 Tax=Actinoplanes sp. NPDC051851 TaxID=3154753 RepID=UPI00342CDDD7
MPQNPYTAPAGGASIHGDSASSTTFTGAGHAGDATTLTRTSLLEACPALLHGSDGVLSALGAESIGQPPVPHLIGPSTGSSRASPSIAEGSLRVGAVRTWTIGAG